MWLARLLAEPYGLAVRLRAWGYAAGWLPSRRLPGWVINVGNLTVGGTGKTPVVIWLVHHLQRQGLKVAVLSRGYKRRSGEAFRLVADGDRVLAGPEEAGDEPYLIAQRCPGAVVAVGADRYRLGCWLLRELSRTKIDGFVLDDGFQHLALKRDLDLLLVDASAPEDLQALLPAGRLREPLAAAARATALMLTRVDQAAEPRAVLEPIAAATGRREEAVLLRFRPAEWTAASGASGRDLGLMKGKPAVIFSGIGNSGSFKQTVAELGVKVMGELVFPDHHAYRPEDIRRLRRLAEGCGAELLLTTEKDAGKVSPLLSPEDRVLALRIDTEIMAGRDRLERLIAETVKGRE